MISIYTLTDPRNGAVRYVGKSAAPLKRLRTHVAKARAGCETHCRRWIAELLRVDLMPVISVIEHAADNDAANEAEARHISALRISGCDLTNLTVGGDGRRAGSRLRPETRARMSAARKGKPPARSVIEAARLAKVGKPRPKSAMRGAWDANRGRKQSPEERARRSAAMTGRTPRAAGWKHTPEAKAKIAAASRARGSAALALKQRWTKKCSPTA